jgi:hypothetical protein
MDSARPRACRLQARLMPTGAAFAPAAERTRGMLRDDQLRACWRTRDSHAVSARRLQAWDRCALKDERGFSAASSWAALTLRPQLVGIGPLLPRVERDLGVSHAVAGLLASVPVLCMGFFAPPAAYVVARIGTRRAIASYLGLIATAGLARAVAPGAISVILLTVPIGVGMGLAGALLPVLVKERFDPASSIEAGSGEAGGRRPRRGRTGRGPGAARRGVAWDCGRWFPLNNTGGGASRLTWCGYDRTHGARSFRANPQSSRSRVRLSA